MTLLRNALSHRTVRRGFLSHTAGSNHYGTTRQDPSGGRIPPPRPHARQRLAPAVSAVTSAPLFLSTVINYVDRQTLAVLAAYVKTEYHRRVGGSPRRPAYNQGLDSEECSRD